MQQTLASLQARVIGARTMTHPPEISTVIAAYNASPFIERAIQSALEQTDISTEVIVVDDGSTDNTVEVVRRKHANDPRVRLIALETNGGPSIARNVGFRAANGRWIAVLDADDAFLPHRLRTMVDEASRSAADLVFDNLQYHDPSSGRDLGTGLASGATADIGLHAFLRGARPYTGQVDYGLLKGVFRRAFLEENAIAYPETVRHGEDFLCYVSILRQGGHARLMHVPGYRYTVRSAGQSRTVVDYRGQIEAVHALLACPDIADDAIATALLRERQDALRRLSLSNRLRALLDEARYRDVPGVLIRDKHAAMLVLRAQIRTVRSRLSHALGAGLHVAARRFRRQDDR